MQFLLRRNDGALVIYLLSKEIKRPLNVRPLPRQALAWLMSVQRVPASKPRRALHHPVQDVPGAVVPLHEHTALKRRDQDTTQLVSAGGEHKCQMVPRTFRRAVHLPPCVLPENNG
jgi:hypothetical protein